MALHLRNDALKCRMFPSSLGPMSLRWFNRLQHSSIHSWDELAEAFVSRFITNSRKPKPKEFDSLMSMRMKDSESLKNYSSRYWEVYNEVDGGTEDMAITAELRHSLSKRPAKNMRDLMSQIQQYVRVEEDRARTRGEIKDNATMKDQRPFTTPSPRIGSIQETENRLPENEQLIFFSDEDLRDVQTPHDDPLVVKLRIGDSDVKRVLIDQGSCFEIMYPDLFHGLGLKQTDLQPYDVPLIGFSGESIRPMGQITMTVHTGPISLDTEFLVVDVPSPYTAIMGRRWLHKLKAVPSSLHQKLRFPTDFGIMEIKGDQVASKQCVMAAIKQNPPGAKQKGKKRNILRSVGDLNPDDRTKLVNFLTSNVDVFAWDPYEVPGVDPDYIQHRLNVDPHSKPVQQKSRRSAPVHAEAMQQPGHDRMSFLDAFQGYHQIALSPEDREKTAFITPLGIYCYKVMPFGLKNAGATYQRMVTRMFKDQIGKTMEIYNDNMVVKSKLSQNHLEDLTKTFRILRLHKLRLNASKCVFGVRSGKFLGFMVSHGGIEVNPDQIKAIQELRAPRTHKEVQRLTGMTAALNRNALSPLEKVGLALIIAAKKLPHYFQAHTIYVVTQYPVQAMFHKADFTGRIWKWGAKIGTLDVKYLPRTAIKGQILADFVAEFTPTTEQEDLNKTTFQENTPENSGWWKIYVDGASNARGSGTGVVIITPDETVIEQSIRLDFKTSNNEAEYEAVLAGLNSAKTLGAQQLIVHCDSLLVASQINGEYMARDERMAAYLLKTLATPSITVPACHIHTITVGPCWMDPYVHYLKEGVLPEQKKEAEIVRRKALRFWLSKESKLYKRSFSGPYLLCVHPDIVEDLLFEIHEGICGSHTGGRSLAHRALTQGYWWPYMQKDAVTYVKKCDKCQRFSHSVHQPAAELLPLVSPWPFAQWGMDLVGPLPRATGNRRWLIVATDYFTKWVEAEPLANIRDKDSIKFVWKNIITRFGIPKTIISDNGTQFTSKPFMKYCSELGIRNVYSSPTYPQSNGQAEASNKTVLDGIKKRLEDAKGRWVEELPNVLWTFRTTPRRSTGETPFSLAYGSEAVIPLEIGLPTLRTSEWEPTRNNLAQSQALDLLEERREQAMIRLASYQQQLKKGYNKNVRPRSFQQGDLVLRKVLGNTKNPTDGKLGPNWEGPYRVRSVTGVGAYHLENLNSIPLPRPWNVSNLRKYFH
uniref:Uncharacterized protein n=1 Tax=Fagus sylvatica TaxID=28930 RepID=A0A2N9HQJ4_FAGSY